MIGQQRNLEEISALNLIHMLCSKLKHSPEKLRSRRRCWGNNLDSRHEKVSRCFSRTFEVFSNDLHQPLQVWFILCHAAHAQSRYSLIFTQAAEIDLCGETKQIFPPEKVSEQNNCPYKFRSQSAPSESSSKAFPQSLPFFYIFVPLRKRN